MSCTKAGFSHLNLELELGGSNFGEYDRLTLTNSLTLDGDLEIELINGFMPRGGQSFQIIVSPGSAIAGQFDTQAHQLPGLTGDLFWQIDYNDPNAVLLRVHSPYTADFDGDGDVDGDDLIAPTVGWRARYGGYLGGADFLNWQRQFGSGVGTASLSVSMNSGIAIPEPHSALLLMLFSVTFPRRATRRV